MSINPIGNRRLLQHNTRNNSSCSLTAEQPYATFIYIIYIYILRMMLQIQKHHSLLKPSLSHLRKGCHDGYAAGRMIQLSPSMNTSLVVRTFLTSVGASTHQLRNNNHFHHPFASEVSIQRSHQNNINIKSATSRHLSSSPIPEPNIPPPKK